MLRRSLLLALLALGSSACSSSLVRVARQQSDAELLIALREPGARLSLREARALAVARGSRAIEEARGDDGIAVVAALASCADALVGPLRARAERRDDVGARAALVLLDASAVPMLPYVRYFADADPDWRAVGARALGIPESNDIVTPCPSGWGPCDEPRGLAVARWRRAAFLDAHVGVRRAGLEAAIDARDPDDLPTLVDAARRDPDPLARQLAIDAIASIGTLDAALVLDDLWSQASEEERVAIVEAWVELFLASSHEAPFADADLAGPSDNIAAVSLGLLSRALDADLGRPSIVAAAALLRVHGEGVATPMRTSLEGRALGFLERKTKSGSVAERALVLDHAPNGQPTLVALWRELARGDDPVLSTAALARISEEHTLATDGERALALEELSRRASQAHPAGELALAALVELRVPAATAALFKSVSSADVAHRAQAARAFSRLGATIEASVMLADPSPEVRAAAVCALATEAAR